MAMNMIQQTMSKQGRVDGRANTECSGAGE
jgi:hypothetical protein